MSQRGVTTRFFTCQVCHSMAARVDTAAPAPSCARCGEVEMKPLGQRTAPPATSASSAEVTGRRPRNPTDDDGLQGSPEGKGF